MEFQQLKCFMALATYRNYASASESLDVGRTGVRLSIRELEKSLNAALFYQNEQGEYLLTDEGNILMRYAKQILSVSDQALARMQHMMDSGAETVRLMFNNNLIHTILPMVCEAYLQTKVGRGQRFSLKMSNYAHEMKRLLSCGDADLGFLQSDNLTGLNSIPVVRDKLYVLLPGTHPLASRRKLRLAELGDFPLILPNLSYLTDNSDTVDSSMNNAIHAMLEAEHISPFISNLSGSYPTRRVYVQAGLGYTITSGYPPVNEHTALVAIDNPYSYRVVYLVWASNRSLSEETDQFKRFCVDYFKNKHDMVIE